MGDSSRQFITQYGSLPDEEIWSTEKYLRYMPTVFEKIREPFGADFDEKEAERYSYERRYHPVVRLEDGTLWNY